MIKILFVCHGNICRSPMAYYYFKKLIDSKGLTDLFELDSAATSREEIGCGVYPPARRKLQENGISCRDHHAKQMTRRDYQRFDYLIGMDSWNIRNMQRIAGGDPDSKICKLLTFAGSSRDVADPWYTDDFDTAWADITEGCDALLEKILRDMK